MLWVVWEIVGLHSVLIDGLLSTLDLCTNNLELTAHTPSLCLKMAPGEWIGEWL